MADQLGVSRNTVGKWLADKARPPKAALLVFAALTEVPYEWITDGQTPAESAGGLRVVAGARPDTA